MWQVVFFIVFDIRHTKVYCQVMLTKHIMFLQAALTLFLLKFFFITFSMLFSCKSTSLNILYSSFVSCCCVCTLSNNVCTHEKRSDIEFIMEWRRKRSLLLKTCKDCNCCVCRNNHSKVSKWTTILVKKCFRNLSKLSKHLCQFYLFVLLI